MTGESILPVIIIALVYYVLIQRRDMRELEAAHKVELASKDATILQLQEKRITEASAGWQALRDSDKTVRELALAIERSRN